MVTTIACDNVDYKSHRKEDFFDIQLTVKGCTSLEDSLHKWVAEERLDGDNKYAACFPSLTLRFIFLSKLRPSPPHVAPVCLRYHAGDFGKQDAKKFVRFAQLPPVLHLQLKRFEFDMTTMVMAKVNTRFAFPEELDMAPFMTDLPEDVGKDGTATAPAATNGAAPKQEVPSSKSAMATARAADAAAASTGTKYLLHSVLVHSGGVHGGHYYAFVRPGIGRTTRAGAAAAAAAAAAAGAGAGAGAAARAAVASSSAPTADSSTATVKPPTAPTLVPPPFPLVGADEPDSRLSYNPESKLGDAVFQPPPPEWYKFDDSAVTPCEPDAAIDHNFGGQDAVSSSYGGRFSHGTSAYMLVYVKASAVNDIMFDTMTDEDGSPLSDEEVVGPARDSFMRAQVSKALASFKFNSTVRAAVAGTSEDDGEAEFSAEAKDPPAVKDSTPGHTDPRPEALPSNKRQRGPSDVSDVAKEGAEAPAAKPVASATPPPAVPLSTVAAAGANGATADGVATLEPPSKSGPRLDACVCLWCVGVRLFAHPLPLLSGSHHTQPSTLTSAWECPKPCLNASEPKKKSSTPSPSPCCVSGTWPQCGARSVLPKRRSTRCSSLPNGSTCGTKRTR